MNRRPPTQDRRFAAARWLFFGTASVLSIGGILLMTDLLWRFGFNGARTLFLIFFSILFTILCVGFTHAFFGFWVRRRTSQSRIMQTLTAEDAHLPLAPTALVFPIYNEDVQRVFAGVRAVFQDLQRTGEGQQVEIYILSDSTQPDNWVREEFAWVQLCREEAAFNRVFYRRRVKNVNRKSGNLADFCQTWGGRYTYMIVMDADSILAGETVVQLIRLMQKNQDAGLIQTAPRISRAQTIFCRMQQFASRAYGPIFQAGLDWWQGSVGNYWGHNAIIRIEPFTEYCDLPDLPGKEPFGGKIMSHDFVEAALMVKAGWQVWLAYDVEGTWEENPPSLVDSAKRDRRWMQGNLQHTWLLLARGLHSGSRMHLMMGIVCYVVSPLWLLFLMLSYWIAWQDKTIGLTKFPVQGFVGRWLNFDQQEHGLLIFGATLVLLFASKILALVDLLLQAERRRQFGGLLSIIGSMIAETVLSSFMAPILMLFHTKFFIWLFLGRSVDWGPQNRVSDGTSWGTALRAHLSQTLIGVGAAILAWWLSPILFYWMLPVTGALAVSIPFSVLTSSQRWGERFRRAGFFIVPEEVQAPPVLANLEARLNQADANARIFGYGPQHGLTTAIVDPYVNAVHVSLLKPLAEDGATPDALRAAGERLLVEGPMKFSSQEVLEILSNADLMLQLHLRVWAKVNGDSADWWRRHVERYRISEWAQEQEARSPA